MLCGESATAFDAAHEHQPAWPPPTPFTTRAGPPIRRRQFNLCAQRARHSLFARRARADTQRRAQSPRLHLRLLHESNNKVILWCYDRTHDWFGLHQGAQTSLGHRRHFALSRETVIQHAHFELLASRSRSAEGSRGKRRRRDRFRARSSPYKTRYSRKPDTVPDSACAPALRRRARTSKRNKPHANAYARVSTAHSSLLLAGRREIASASHKQRTTRGIKEPGHRGKFRDAK